MYIISCRPMLCLYHIVLKRDTTGDVHYRIIVDYRIIVNYRIV